MGTQRPVPHQSELHAHSVSAIVRVPHRRSRVLRCVGASGRMRQESQVYVSHLSYRVWVEDRIVSAPSMCDIHDDVVASAYEKARMSEDPCRSRRIMVTLKKKYAIDR